MSATPDAAPRPPRPSLGPGSPFQCLFDESPDAGSSLTEELAAVYGAPWRLPAPSARPYVYSNFVVSRDGRVSFAEPGHMSGVDVAGFDLHDKWLMALLRSRADAILMGDNTLRIEPDHIWTAEFLWPDDAEAFRAQRRAEGRLPRPLQVFLSLEGDLDVRAAAVFADEAAHVVVATTEAGAARARTLAAPAARVDVLALGREAVDVGELLGRLGADYGVSTVLCEGGPRAYGSVIAARCLDDEFLTLSPTVIGSAPDRPRPSLVEGVAFPADAHPRSRPLSLHRGGEMLYLRSRYAFP
ncbi:MAG: dihydrofolate reductase family protein [Gaiella sp.]|nr:dihydrofolate reductase family protein [Gaiella sp.]